MSGEVLWTQLCGSFTAFVEGSGRVGALYGLPSWCSEAVGTVAALFVAHYVLRWLVAALASALFSGKGNSGRTDVSQSKLEASNEKNEEKSKPVAKTSIPCTNPATSAKLGEVPVTTPAEVRAIVVRARKAQAEWAKTSFKKRQKVLRMLLQAVLDDQDEIVRVSAVDSGKPKLDAVLGEIVTVCEKLRWTAANGEKYLRPESRSSGIMAFKSGRVEYLPLGVFGVIIPWNYPFQNIFGSIISPLFAGNACVVKPSEWTSWSTAYFAKLIHNVLDKCNVSRDLVQFVSGYAETGAALVNSGVDKIIFIGSPGNGRRVMETASRTLTPVVLELGGKDPMILCDDCDLKQVVPIALRGCFQHCGQNCVGVERIYVFSKIYDKFVEGVVAGAKGIRQGDPTGAETVDCGAMVMPAQVDIVQELVDDAIKKGATALVGGNRNTSPQCSKGQFFQPTILVNVDHSMRIAREEVFGPVMLVFRVHDDEEAISLANNCAYGLASSVFSNNRARAEKIASAIRAGTTTINDWAVGYLLQDLPFGGVGASGFGKFNGPEGLRDCCITKSVVNERFGVRTFLPGGMQYPVNDVQHLIMQEGMRILYSQAIVGKALALARLLNLVVRGKSAAPALKKDKKA